jgi:hypothetical protein
MKNEGDVKKIVKKTLAGTERCWWFMPPANGYGRAGIPDFVGWVNGMPFAVETKFGKGVTTANQNREINDATHAGGEVWIVRETNVDQWVIEFKAWVALNASDS